MYMLLMQQRQIAMTTLRCDRGRGCMHVRTASSELWCAVRLNANVVRRSVIATCAYVLSLFLSRTRKTLIS